VHTHGEKNAIRLELQQNAMQMELQQNAMWKLWIKFSVSPGKLAFSV
jgi:hypothetical protein